MLLLPMFLVKYYATFRSNHSEKVFSSIETIMTLVLEESEDISSELLSCLLACTKKNSEVNYSFDYLIHNFLVIFAPLIRLGFRMLCQLLAD